MNIDVLRGASPTDLGLTLQQGASILEGRAHMGRRILFRGAVAAGGAVAGLAGSARVAFADINEPVPIPRADGRQELYAPLRYAGRVVHLLGVNGMDVPILGWRYPGATLISVLGTGTDMGINAIGLPAGITGNPDEVYPGSYPEGMPKLTEKMKAERLRHIDQLGVPVRGISLALVRDAITRTYIPKVEEDTNPGWGTLPITDQNEGLKPAGVQSTTSATAGLSNGACNPLAITSLGPRPDAEVNGTRVHLEVRDLNSCIRPLFRHETGVAVGQNYKISLPDARWSVIIASTTAEIQREGGGAQQFLNGPVIKIQGPFFGGAGVYEGALEVDPEEWADFRIQQIVAIQRQQTYNPGLQPRLFQG